MTKAQWVEQTISQLREMDKNSSRFYTRITGQIVGNCPVTVGYIGKHTSTFNGKTEYYFTKDLKTVFQPFEWHCIFANEINKRLKKDEKKYKIHILKSLNKAIEMLQL